MNTLVKKAYLSNVLTRKLIRRTYLQKVAATPGEAPTPAAPIEPTPETPGPKSVPAAPVAPSASAPTESVPAANTGGKKERKPTFGESMRDRYMSSKYFRTPGGLLTAGLAGAGITGLVGALVQAARGKDILSGLLVGGDVGAALGAGGKYYSDKSLRPGILEKYPIYSTLDALDKLPEGTNVEPKFIYYENKKGPGRIELNSSNDTNPN